MGSNFRVFSPLSCVFWGLLFWEPLFWLGPCPQFVVGPSLSKTNTYVGLFWFVEKWLSFVMWFVFTLLMATRSGLCSVYLRPACGFLLANCWGNFRNGDYSCGLYPILVRSLYALGLKHSNVLNSYALACSPLTSSDGWASELFWFNWVRGRTRPFKAPFSVGSFLRPYLEKDGLLRLPSIGCCSAIFIFIFGRASFVVLALFK